MDYPDREPPLNKPVVDALPPSDSVRMGRLVAVMYGLAIGGIALFFGRESLEPGIYLYKRTAGLQAALAVAGWLIATLGPIVLSACVWLMVRRLRAGWLVHLVFIPAAIITCRGGGYLFFYGAGVSGENSPEGYALLMASVLLVLTLLVHTAALIVEVYKKIRKRVAVPVH